MAAQDVATRTNAEIEAAAMSVLVDALGGDNESNVAKTLDACKIKDPSLIMSLSDDEIGELKINKNNKLSFMNGKRLMLFEKYCLAMLCAESGISKQGMQNLHGGECWIPSNFAPQEFITSAPLKWPLTPSPEFGLPN